MSFTFVAGVTIVGERARRAGHAIAARLVRDVCYITPTNFVVRLTVVLFCHSTVYVCDHTIITFDIVLE